MLTIERLQEMLDLQEKLEVRIGGEDWRNEGHDYALCVHMECAEIIDAYGWKHWKDLDADPDFDKIAMEVVDVWHFAMAYLLMSPEFNTEVLHGSILEAIQEYQPDSAAPLYHQCVGMSFSMYAVDKFPLGNFVALMDIVNMNFDDLYKLYISKNVLNWFRQDHGYKEGLYLKNWAGREDNEHLQELMEGLGDDLSVVELYKALVIRYELVRVN